MQAARDKGEGQRGWDLLILWFILLFEIYTRLNYINISLDNVSTISFSTISLKLKLVFESQ